MKRKIENIATCAGIAFIAYGLYDGFLVVNWPVVAVLVIWVLLRVLLGFHDRKKAASLKREQQEGTLIHDYVRAPIYLRAICLIVVFASWGVVLFFIIMTEGSIAPPAWMYLFLIGVTLLFRYGTGYVWNVIIYSEHEVICKNGLRKKVYAWSEFGEVKQFHERMTFRDKNGKKLFMISTVYDGFAGFYNVYRSEHPEYVQTGADTIR